MKPFFQLDGHKVPTLSLYRVVLRHLNRIDHGRKGVWEAKIKAKFHRFKHLLSPAQTKKRLTDAYNLLPVLRGASLGNSEDLEKLDAIFPKREKQVQLVTPCKPLPDTAKLKKRTSKSKRKQDVVAIASPNFPFLRKPWKPQSQELSMTLKNRVLTNQKRHDRLDSMTDLLHLSRWEENWCRIFSPSSLGWSRPPQDALQQVRKTIRIQSQRMQAKKVDLDKIVEEQKQRLQGERRRRLRRRKALAQEVGYKVHESSIKYCN